MVPAKASNIKDKIMPKKLSINVPVVTKETKNTLQENRKAKQEEFKSKIELQRNKCVVSSTSTNGTIAKQTEPKKTKLVIKQTRASKLRLEKNNPFHGYSLDEIKKVAENIKLNNTNVQPVRNTQLDTRQTLSDRKERPAKVGDIGKTKRFSRLELLSKPKTQPPPKQENNSKNVINQKKLPKNPVRRSISSIHIRKSGIERDEAKNRCIRKTGMFKSYSEENISSSRHLNIPSPIAEESEPSTSRLSFTGRKAVMFMSPVRRNSRRFSCNTPLPSELRQQLIDWLKKRGKSLNSYRHLRCFGIHQSTPYRPTRKSGNFLNNYDDDENKENNEEYATSVNPEDDNDIPKIIDYTNHTTNADIFGTPINLKINNQDTNKLASEALCDLHALILEKYPQEQCMAWLSALRRKYPNLQEQPQYWECRAALGEINGEFNEAVECYQEAIIKGAEVSKIDHSLETLLEKFSVLDLDASTKRQDTVAKKQRSKIILDARNIFKSSVIKFAVSQRETRTNLKDQAEALTPLVAKPVRRSTRKSTNCYSTPKDTVYESLKEIEFSFHQSVCFENNRALIDNS